MHGSAVVSHHHHHAARSSSPFANIAHLWDCACGACTAPQRALAHATNSEAHTAGCPCSDCMDLANAACGDCEDED